MPVALVLRGHERDVFLNSRLYEFVKLLTKNFNLDIYIHTWTKSVGTSSWRDLSGYEAREINEATVRDYFQDIPIKKIFIEDETEIELNGDLSGNICLGPCPRLAWKRMWYGKYKILDFLTNSSDKFYDFTLNMRFDVFENINNIYSEKDILKKCHKISAIKSVNQIYFLKDQPCSGIDNCYIGNQKAMFFLARDFHNDLSSIEKLYKHNFYTEYLVYFEALRLNFKIWRMLLEKTHNITKVRLQ